METSLLFASLYLKCSDMCFYWIHAYWIPHVLKFLNVPEKSHRLILKLPFIYKAWGYWILIHSNVLVWTVKQFFILTAFPWEKSVFFHGSTPLFQPQKGQGQGNQGNMCWLSISLYFKLVILIFFFWFIEIALYLNHIIQVGRILISTLTFVSVINHICISQSYVLSFLNFQLNTTYLISNSTPNPKKSQNYWEGQMKQIISLQKKI